MLPCIVIFSLALLKVDSVWPKSRGLEENPTYGPASSCWIGDKGERDAWRIPDEGPLWPTNSSFGRSSSVANPCLGDGGW